MSSIFSTKLLSSVISLSLLIMGPMAYAADPLEDDRGTVARGQATTTWDDMDGDSQLDVLRWIDIEDLLTLTKVNKAMGIHAHDHNLIARSLSHHPDLLEREGLINSKNTQTSPDEIFTILMNTEDFKENAFQYLQYAVYLKNHGDWIQEASMSHALEECSVQEKIAIIRNEGRFFPEGMDDYKKGLLIKHFKALSVAHALEPYEKEFSLDKLDRWSKERVLNKLAEFEVEKIQAIAANAEQLLMDKHATERTRYIAELIGLSAEEIAARARLAAESASTNPD